MLRVAVVCGGILWFLTIAASAAMNAFAGYAFGRTPIEGYIFATLGIAADGWKALAPVYLVSLTRARRPIVSAAAALLWIACFTYAVSSALGLAAQNRLAATGGREAIAASLAAVSAELSELKLRRARIQITRSPEEIDAAIAAALSQASGDHGTIGTLSNDCVKDTAKTRMPCTAIAALRTERASASEAQRLEARINELAHDAARLTEQGGKGETDPQARVIATILQGMLTVKQVDLGLLLSLVIMVELVSAFGPLVLTEFARAEGIEIRPGATGRSARCRPDAGIVPVGTVFEYMAENVGPAPKGTVTVPALTQSYEFWCQWRRLAVLPTETFLEDFERICRDELDGRVQRHGDHFEGLELTASAPLAVRMVTAEPASGRSAKN